MKTVSMKSTLLFAALLMGTSIAGVAAESGVPVDPRQAVEMPPLQRALMREEMVHHLSSLNDMFGLLNAGKLKESAEVAERDLGFSSMGKHAARTQGMGPGRFMPDAMRAIGIGMHKSASEFAETARKGNREAAYKALEPVMGACVACHAGYRLK